MRNNSRGLLNTRRIVLGGIVGIALILLLLRAVAPGVLVSVSRPLWSLGASLSAAVGNTTHTERLENVRQERDALVRQLEEARNRALVLEAKNNDLARLAPSEDRITAGVLVRPPVSPYDTLVVAAGTEAGVLVGARVYGPGGVPLGVVELVSPAYAHVGLYSAPGRTTEGWVGEARVPITLVGAGAGSFNATISKDAAIQVGEQVLIPGPGALPIGTVARVDTDPSSPTARVFVRPLVNPFTVTDVAIGALLP